MKLRKFVWGALAALASLPALAGGIDGRWNATVDSPQGAITLLFEFKAEGEKLNGSLSGDMFPATPISDGVIKGDAVTFKLSLQFGPDMPPLVIAYQGTLKGDDLELNSVLDMGQGPTETKLVARRAKS